MIRYSILILCFFSSWVFSQTQIAAKAPNSYIYDLDLASSNKYGGIKIPVIKAYEMWSKYEYLKSNGAPNPIPAGLQSASVYWEDVPGLVENVTIEEGSTPADSKIAVAINGGKGKGNAVVAFKVDGKIYWSWHIWVTDNPTNGVSYNYGMESDIDLNLISIQYMDRNLGATSNSFLGDQWQKSGGLMYEWGRKDPFPPLVYKDADFYEISGEVGVLKHKQIDPVNTIPVQVRPYNEIEKNIQYSVNNPLTYIINTDEGGNWFSNQRYKVAGTSPNYITWDLWSDNAKGGNSNANSSNTTLKNESRSYELKSELDPCPNGWRVPSYKGRETQNNNLAFFGKHDWNNDDNVVANRQIFPNSVNPSLDGIKVYPGLGMDFTNAQGGGRNLGNLSISGGYVYYPNPAAPTAPVGVTFQDNSANGGLWSATYAYDGARIFSMISDPLRTNTSVGLHAIYNNITNPTRSGNAVKCMKDPNLSKIGNFATEYFSQNYTDYKTGLDYPNSYIIMNETSLQIPVSKAYAVYNQILTNHQSPIAKNIVAKVLWTDNPNLVASAQVFYNSRDYRDAVIKVAFNAGERGNAVISLHNASAETAPFWSWHLWAPEEDPRLNTVSYSTETPLATNGNFVNPSASKSPPLKTVFMDRNLGAKSSDINSGEANGLHYQWGRKDPIPTFGANNSKVIYIPSGGSDRGQIGGAFGSNKINYTTINEAQYSSDYTESYEDYKSSSTNISKKIRENIFYSVSNPMTFLYQNSFGNLYDGGNHYGNDLTKIKDWVSEKRGDAENRWGHADKKSPFDPCPEGWRVPDVSFTNLYTGSKGTSPWYNGYQADAYGKAGVIQDQWHAVNTFYGGTSSANGWKFEGPTFNIGNFPKDGIRGELGGKDVSFFRTGVWTASLADLHTGFALAMQFDGVNNKMQTGTGVYPQAGMSVRCAKDENRLLGTPITKNKPAIVLKDYKEDLVPAAGNGELKIYPNPFKVEFTVQNAMDESFEIYDFSGKLVLKGNFNNGKVTASQLLTGIYVLKIKLKNGTEITKKLVKQ